jgi:TatD DNase family protein
VPEPHPNLAERIAQTTAMLSAIRNSQQRLSKVVDLVRTRPPMAEGSRLDSNLVPGCQVRLWLACEFPDGICHIQTDSDAVTLKALTGLFADLANGLPQGEVARFDAGFLEDLGILKQLAESRRATVLRVAEAIRESARRPLPDADCPTSDLRFCDAHNHLQDERFAGRQDEMIAICRSAGVTKMVVNGACEADWPQVAALARRFPELVIPSFGYHPWFLHERSLGWRDALVSALDQTPGAVIGEIGLDRWLLDQSPIHRARYFPTLGERAPASMEDQEDAFVWQLRLAAERDLPASIHCLQAFGLLEQVLKSNPLPVRGFLLHSYGGPTAMVPGFATLGAYFSFPGYFLHERKQRQRDVFRAVPSDRLLVETDAPDQPLPQPEFVVDESADRPLNHPANIVAVYRGLATFLGKPLETLTAEVAQNFERMFRRKPV